MSRIIIIAQFYRNGASRQLDAFRFVKNPPTTGESVFQERT